MLTLLNLPVKELTSKQAIMQAMEILAVLDDYKDAQWSAEKLIFDHEDTLYAINDTDIMNKVIYIIKQKLP